MGKISEPGKQRQSTLEIGDSSELPVTHRGVVYPWQCDHVGHMNVTFYVAKFDEATWQLMRLVGITPAYLRAHERGMAALEQKITYKRELRAGDLVTVRSVVLEMREKVIRFYHEMVNDETGEVAATMVTIGVHLNTVTRKSCPFPVEILARGLEMVTVVEQ
jgi:acyl-CoA thioester hydrolase